MFLEKESQYFWKTNRTDKCYDIYSASLVYNMRTEFSSDLRHFFSFL